MGLPPCLPRRNHVKVGRAAPPAKADARGHSLTSGLRSMVRVPCSTLLPRFPALRASSSLTSDLCPLTSGLAPNTENRSAPGRIRRDEQRITAPPKDGFAAANSRGADAISAFQGFSLSAFSTSGFTLIEMTVVILIIATLAAILMTGISSVFERARRTQAKNDVTQIVTAVNAFYTEYGKYPVIVTSSTTDAFFGTGTTLVGCTSYGNNDVLIDVLTNNTSSTNNAATVTALNPRGIVFLNVPAAKSITNPRSGVIPNGATVTAPLRVGVRDDPWGSPYAVACDTTYDNALGTANPYTDSDFSAGPSPLQVGAIAYSYGRNGALGGGAAVSSAFSSESGTAGKFKGSSDILSWQ